MALILLILEKQPYFHLVLSHSGKKKKLNNGICREYLQQAKLTHWWVSLQDKDMDLTFSNLDTKIIPHLV